MIQGMLSQRATLGVAEESWFSKVEKKEAIKFLLEARKKALEDRLPRAAHLEWRAMLRPDVFDALRRCFAEIVIGVACRDSSDTMVSEVAEIALNDDKLLAFGFQIGRDPNAIEPVLVSVEQRRGKLLRVQLWQCNIGCGSTVETRTQGETLLSAVCPHCKAVLRPQFAPIRPHLVVEF